MAHLFARTRLIALHSSRLHHAPSNAGRMMLFALTLCLVAVNGLLPETWTAPGVYLQSHAPTERDVGQKPTVLSDLFREVKILVEDTQGKLEDAEHQTDNESTKSIQPIHNITSNYSNQSSSEISTGNQSIPAAEPVDEISGNTTEEIHTTRTSNQSCSTDHACGKDEECCEGQLCVLGQCMNSTKGEAGTICQKQSDCSSDLCCAYHKGLLFPVCSPNLKEHEPCSFSPNHLKDLQSWDLGHTSPQQHCPCAADLQCQHLGRGLVCLKGPTSSEEALSDTLYSEIDYIV